MDKEDIKREEEKRKQIFKLELNSIAHGKEQYMIYKGITIHKNKTCETWYTRYRLNGKQYYISARTQKECYNKLKKALSETENNIINIPNQSKERTPTLKEWYDKWLSLYKIGKVKVSTLRLYNIVFNHINPEIQNKSINNISLEEIIITLNSCHGERQKQNLYDLLNVLFKKAMDNEILDKNIISRIEKPKHVKIHSQALDNKQQEELIEICSTIPHGDILIVALYQGLRRGEVLGLTIDNIDYENNTLTINKTLNRKNEFDTTKNRQSVRTMPMFEKTKIILLKYKNEKGRIFNLSSKQYDLVLEKIKQASNISNLKTKDMRATFITRCKELDVPKHVIQAWVGHIIGSSVTDTVYTSHNKDIDYKYVNILNKSKFYSNSTHN